VLKVGSTPLWPAGHLPLKGGDQIDDLLSLTSEVKTGLQHLLISPLEGEMAGRPEGGAA
jgi:assimilatory nitrate reductase catalytic subunit